MSKVKKAICVLYCMVVPIQSTSAEEIDLQEALARLEAAIASISTYDLRLQVTHTRPVVAGRSNFAYRQVLDGKSRRLESFDTLAGDRIGIKVFDGKVETRIHFAHKNGLIQSGSYRFVRSCHDYEMCYRKPFTGPSLVALFRQRGNLSVTADKDGMWLVDAPPKPSTMYARYGVRVQVDSTKGMMPRRIESYIGDPTNTHRRMIVRKFHQPQVGVWVPTNVLFTEHSAAAVHETRVVVDMDNSSWNQDVPEAEFSIEFPPNIQVFDNIRNTTFVTGQQE